MRVVASGARFRYQLTLSADKPPVPEGDKGYSRKSVDGRASYYFSQPFYAVEGELVLRGAPIKVSGRAWMDREWTSQPLSPDQKGWDWFSLHLSSGEKLMLFRLRERVGPRLHRRKLDRRRRGDAAIGRGMFRSSRWRRRSSRRRRCRQNGASPSRATP